MKRSIIFVFSILSTLTLITSCHRFDFEYDSRHSAPEVVDVMFTITDTFSEYVKYDLDIQFNQAYSEDFKIAVQHSYSTDTYINESGNNKLTISVEINKDDFEQNEDGIFVYHVAISALDKYGTPIGQVYDLELTYEHVDGILIDTTFNTALKDALDGYTELKFVANSAYRAQTTPLFTDKNGTKAYAIKNGSCLEVHTLANLFVAPADCSRMFHDLYNLTTIEFNDCFDTSQVTNMHAMFYYCESLTSLDLSNFDTSKVTDIGFMFTSCKSLTSLDLSNFDTSQVTDIGFMFTSCKSLTSLDLSNFDTSQVTDMSVMFSNCIFLTSLDLSNFNTSQVTDMHSMFYNCESLTSLDLSNFDTSQVTNMYDMFYYCKSLTSLDMSNFNTSKVTNMGSMFNYCESLASLDLSNFDTSQVTDMGLMFYYCESLASLDLSNFDTSQVTDMSAMFYYCESLTSLDLSNFNTSQVTDMSGMFDVCESLTSLDLSNFDTSRVTDMKYMFAYCNTLSELDISSFSFSLEPDIRYMFEDLGSSLDQATIPVYVSQAGKEYLDAHYTSYTKAEFMVVN